jgi:hypothetical protein
MARLADLLEYLAQPGVEDKWVLLDIKVGSCSGASLIYANALIE